MLSALKGERSMLGGKGGRNWEEIPLTRMRTADTDTTTDDEGSPRHVSIATPTFRKWNKQRSVLFLKKTN